MYRCTYRQGGDGGNWHTFNEEAADVNPKEQSPSLDVPRGDEALPFWLLCREPLREVYREAWAGVSQREPWSGGLGPWQQFPSGSQGGKPRLVSRPLTR